MNENEKANKGLKERTVEVLEEYVGLVALIAAGFVGYKFGEAITSYRIDLGLYKCNTVDPGLTDRIIEDCHKVLSTTK